jgi:hypothetical protein
VSLDVKFESHTTAHPITVSKQGYKEVQFSETAMSLPVEKDRSIEVQAL